MPIVAEIDTPMSSSERPIGGVGKRAFDATVAVSAILILLPLLVVVALIIKFTDKGPVFFSHKRIGFGGTTFRCLKFRTMAVDGTRILADHLARDPAAALEWAQTQKLRDDPRVTAVGRFLRASSLDELPQLWNVACGEMSLVGPRPIVDSETAHYGRAIRFYLSVRPGLTGLWQVSGRSGTTYRRRVALDKAYVCRWSFGGDIVILCKTIPAVLLAKGSW